MTTPPDIERWLLLYLAVLGGEPVEALDPHAPLSLHDLDSFDAVQMSVELTRAYGVSVEPEFFLDGARSIAEAAAAIRPYLGDGGA
jgi:acyl carrier protein